MIAICMALVYSASFVVAWSIEETLSNNLSIARNLKKWKSKKNKSTKQTNNWYISGKGKSKTKSKGRKHRGDWRPSGKGKGKGSRNDGHHHHHIVWVDCGPDDDWYPGGPDDWQPNGPSKGSYSRLLKKGKRKSSKSYKKNKSHRKGKGWYDLDWYPSGPSKSKGKKKGKGKHHDWYPRGPSKGKGKGKGSDDNRHGHHDWYPRGPSKGKGKGKGSDDNRHGHHDWYPSGPSKGKGKGKGSHHRHVSHRCKPTETPTYSPWTNSPTHSPLISSPTLIHSPTDMPHVYFGDDGSISCFPEDESYHSGYKYDGPVDKKVVHFQYSLETTPNSDEEEMAKKVEMEIAKLLFSENILDCAKVHGAKRRVQDANANINDAVRKLDVIGIDPEPWDTVTVKDNHCDVNCCNENCHYVESGMTVITDASGTSYSDEQICNIVDLIKDYTSNYQPGDIEGVESVALNEDAIGAEGVYCGDIQPEQTIPISRIEGTESVDQGGLNALWSCVFVGTFLAFVGLFISRRRREAQLREMQNRRIDGLEDDLNMDDLNLDDSGVEPPKGGLTAVDVHVCHSQSCTSCQDNSNHIQFIPTNSPSWLNEKDATPTIDEDLPFEEDSPFLKNHSFEETEWNNTNRNVQQNEI